MLHQPTAHFPPAPPPPAPGFYADGRPIFDPAAYVDAMRAVGATFHPVRGRPGTIDLNGTYTVEAPTAPKARRHFAAIAKTFAPGLAADTASAGRIAEYLFTEAAARRFAAIVGDDWAVALRELTRLREELWKSPDRKDDDPELARAGELASEAYHAAVEHALGMMPVRRAEDLALKAEIALRHSSWDGHLRQALVDIAAFGRPGLAGQLPETALAAA